MIGQLADPDPQSQMLETVLLPQGLKAMGMREGFEAPKDGGPYYYWNPQTHMPRITDSGLKEGQPIFRKCFQAFLKPLISYETL